MKPILKWTGGKTRELEVIKSFLPKKYNRLIEPFLGGGAVFFNFEDAKNITNDFNKELVLFYKMIQDNRLHVFEKIVNQISLERTEALNLDIHNKTVEEIYDLAKEIGKMPLFENYLSKELELKTNAISKINISHASNDKDNLTQDEVAIFYRTAIIAAIYYTYREAYNAKNLSKAFDDEHIAYWFIMRELGYSGMFRFSQTGEFNVPYGGMSYNTKSLLKKMDRIKLIQQQDFYKTCEFNNEDFETFFKKYDYFQKDDFIFLDPPYDSEFSQYNIEEDFTKADQVRLRDTLLKTKAKIMVVIKETQFIREIYQKDFYFNDFNKSYNVNFKNRNDRGVNHLVITNYKT